jgi:hypothetical protein
LTSCWNQTVNTNKEEKGLECLRCEERERAERRERREEKKKTCPFLVLSCCGRDAERVMRSK